MVGRIVLFNNNNNQNGSVMSSSMDDSTMSGNEDQQHQHQQHAASKRKAAAINDTAADDDDESAIIDGLLNLRRQQHPPPNQHLQPPHNKRARTTTTSSCSTIASSNNERKRVRFSPKPPQCHVFDNPLSGLTPEEQAVMREAIWYTRQDFDVFLRDRIDTIQLWRIALGEELEDPYYGNQDNIECYSTSLKRQRQALLLSRSDSEDFCLRGLEPYQSSRVNAELHFLRDEHLRAILQEQERQRQCHQAQQQQQQQQSQSQDTSDSSSSSQPPQQQAVTDPERLRAVVAARSAWAMQRAARLGIQDSLDVIAMEKLQQHPPQQRPSLGSMAKQRRFSMPMMSSAAAASDCSLPSPSYVSTASFPSSSSLSTSRFSSLGQNLAASTMTTSRLYSPRRNSIAGGTSNCNNNNGGTNGLRVPVDVHKLKEMNKQFLQQYMMNNKNQEQPQPQQQPSGNASCNLSGQNSNSNNNSTNPTSGVSSSTCSTTIPASAADTSFKMPSLSTRRSSSRSGGGPSSMSLNSLMAGARTHRHIAAGLSTGGRMSSSSTVAAAVAALGDVGADVTPSSFLRPMVRRDSLYGGSKC